ncbi:MAG TPA: copper chaperone PCu(A)C [Halothiobacillaceae bacterium]|nr:copper chaperone PCu(A)C [Halothiobacillaceae bacterium]
MRLPSAFPLITLAFMAVAVSSLPARAADPVAVGDLSVLDPWARASAGSAANGAAYLEIRNAGSQSDWLLGAESPVAMATHIHETTMDGGVMRMRPVEGLEIPAGGTVSLRPQGLHIMFMKLHAPLSEGESIALTLVFERAGRIELTVPVAGPGAMESPAAQTH